ncbi:hypothetical protein J3Q64DRAFT_1733581 [Phycomyces blakesleeanus]|uniref:Uncharacterized protein n=1 Tax=Phycomyces blakesleeanus TaxID=4837 RepID=A0ABR3B1Z4_PHYBL
MGKGQEYVIYLETEEEERQQITRATQRRWLYVRRFILSLVGVGLVMHCLALTPTPTQLAQYWQSFETSEAAIATTAATAAATRTINSDNYPSQAAAIAFSPHPSLSPVSITNTRFAADGFFRKTTMDEGWWDRIFHRGHVHLTSVQLAVRSPDLSSLQATVKICTTTHSGLWKNVPDSVNCVAEKALKVAPEDLEDEESAFGILEWIPDDVIVLKKRQLYWLVVEAQVDNFDWVFAQAGINPYGSALETEEGWQLQSQEEPVPTTIIVVQDHS